MSPLTPKTESILEAEKDILEYSKPILGLYLSIATVCASEIKDQRLNELSARAYGINPVFGVPAVLNSKQRSLQAQRIIDFDRTLPEFDWSVKDNKFDETLKQLGDVLGFTSFRPEKAGNGTLDVCWEDEEKKIVIGFENKVDKSTKVLAKRDIDQCSGHNNWLTENYKEYTKILFVVCDIEGYNELASPLNLHHLKVKELERVTTEVLQVHAKKSHPDQIDPSLDQQKLRIDNIFPLNKVSALPKLK